MCRRAEPRTVSEKANGGKGKWDGNGETRIYELPFAPLRYKSRIST